VPQGGEEGRGPRWLQMGSGEKEEVTEKRGLYVKIII
jgi:hypothetical protein